MGRRIHRAGNPVIWFESSERSGAGVSPAILLKENNMELFFVWNSGPRGLIPRFRHPSIESAKAEAERLAALYPNTEFHVLQSIGFCQKKEVEWTRIDGISDDGIPF